VAILVQVDDATTGTITNAASVTSTETDTNTANNSTTEPTTINSDTASLSGSVFVDLSNDGIRDAGEAAIFGVSIVLFGVDDSGTPVIRRTTTDANGDYGFALLPPGSYTVLEAQPFGFGDGIDMFGSGANGGAASNDAFVDVILPGGASAQEFNFGELLPDGSKRRFLASSVLVGSTQVLSQPITGQSTLAGSVVVDLNQNDVFDSGETGLPGVLVTLAGRDSSGNTVVIRQTTDSTGQFIFRVLPAGIYHLIEAQPIGFQDGADLPGTPPPASIIDDAFAAISLGSSENGEGFDFLERFASGSMIPLASS
jgi:large repetitive protein